MVGTQNRSMSVLSVLLMATLAIQIAGAKREILQSGCAQPSTTSAAPPEGALLYLSVRGPGSITYRCGPDNQPAAVLNESLSVTSQEGYTGKVYINKEGLLQIDVTTKDGKASAEVIADPQPLIQPGPSQGLPNARWAVDSTAGDSPAVGGLPPIAYVVRVDAVGGKGPCPENTTKSTSIEATYNLYTCEVAYLGPGAAPVPAIAPSPAVIVQAPENEPAPAPTLEEPEFIALEPIAAPEPALAPEVEEEILVVPADEPEPEPIQAMAPDMPAIAAPTTAPVASSSACAASAMVARFAGAAALAGAFAWL